MSQNSFIQNYYQAYDQLNDLLEEVTCIVFKNISDDLQIENSFSITVSSEDCYEHAIFMAIRSFH